MLFGEKGIRACHLTTIEASQLIEGWSNECRTSGNGRSPCQLTGRICHPLGRLPAAGAGGRGTAT